MRPFEIIDQTISLVLCANKYKNQRRPLEKYTTYLKSSEKIMIFKYKGNACGKDNISIPGFKKEIENNLRLSFLKNNYNYSHIFLTRKSERMFSARLRLDPSDK